MPYSIRSAAVIGAGTMGAGIAAHLANAGIPCLLLDLPTDGPDRNALARKGLERVRKSRPAAFMSPDREALVTIGNTDDDLARAGACDWVIEAAFERLDVKRDLYAKLEPHLGPRTLITSNSSGIPMRLQCEGRSPEFRRRFFGTHFFNPPRYLHLLEIIPGPDTDPEALRAMADFADRVLGKGVVVAHDVPGFAANRLGGYSWLKAMKAAVELDLSPDVVDYLTGPLIGRPKSATFRTGDLSGLDILYEVGRQLGKATGEDFEIPPALEELVNRKWLGEKTGQGFYRREKRQGGGSAILTLNLKTFEYEERGKVRLDELEAVRVLPTPEARHAALLDMPGPHGEFLRRTTWPFLAYVGGKIGEVAATAAEVDNAVKWGFGWDVGPLEFARYLGEEKVRAGLAAHGLEMPPRLEEYLRGPAPTGVFRLKDLHRAGKVVLGNADASLVDLGDGVACLEYHSKANSIGETILDFTRQALARVEQDFVGLVVGNQGENFSAGANLALLLELSQSADWDRIDQAVRIFQGMTSSLRHSPFPVVAAPFKVTLGGGCEVMLWADAAEADAELYTGLVEVGVGILPAGGGTTEMLIRMTEALPAGADPFLAVQKAFELIALGKVSASALEARSMGFLRKTDGIVMNGDRILPQAKARVLALAPGYVPAPLRRVRVLGEAAYANLLAGVLGMQAAGHVTEYEVHLAKTIARVLTGGLMNRPSEVDESVLLDLEREAFLALCGQEKTRERLAHTLKTGKTLRN